MQEDDALPGRGEVPDGLLELRRPELGMIAAEHEEVRLRKQREGLLEVRRRGDVITGGLGGQRVGTEEEGREVVRTAGAGDEHAELAVLTRPEGLTISLGGLGVILGEQVAGAFVGLALLLAGLGRTVVLACGRVRRATDLDGDGDGGRSDGRVFGAQDEFVDHLVAFDRDPMRTHLAAVAGEQLTGGLGLRDIARAIVIGEVDAAVEDLPLHLAAEEMHLGDHGDGVAVRTPAADGTEEVDAIGHGADGDLDLLREGL